MNNANRIRNMSDDEMARFLFRWQVNSVVRFMELGGMGGMNMIEMKEWLQGTEPSLLEKWEEENE